MSNPKIALRMMVLILAAGLAAAAFGVPQDDDSNEGQRYEVMVTNLTRGQQFTPILVATHGDNVNLFTLGSPSSPELATLAEEGNTAPLAGLLMATRRVADVKISGGLLNPGASTSVTVQGGGRAGRVSLAAMLIPTNDGFFSLNAVDLPKGNAVMTVFSPAYDSGSERNDELCASIPGPFFLECGGGGGGGMPAGGEEGYVHIHAGMHGIGNFSAAMRDWRNPVARIAIRRLR